MNLKALKGSVTEMRVIAELLNRGYPVYTPSIQNGHVDCIIETVDGFKKIQIKYARRKNTTSNSVFVPIGICRNKQNYAEVGIDFIVAESNNRFFVLSKEEFMQRKQRWLAVNYCEGTWFKIPLPKEEDIIKVEHERQFSFFN